MKSPLIFLSLANLFLFSCEEVIDLDLDSTQPETVVEGTVEAGRDVSVVQITRTVPFDSPNRFPPVSGAAVSLSDGVTRVTLAEVTPGVYSAPGLAAVSRKTYLLSVDLEGKVLTAESTLPDQVPFDSLTVTRQEASGIGPGSGGGEKYRYEVIAWLNDPADQKNFYRFTERINGEMQNANYVNSDRIMNGRRMSVILNNPERKLKSGDTLTVELQCIDEAVYTYFNSFGSNSGRAPGGVAPANPESNIKGVKLGVFSAHTSEKRSWIVP